MHQLPMVECQPSIATTDLKESDRFSIGVGWFLDWLMLPVALQGLIRVNDAYDSQGN